MQRFLLSGNRAILRAKPHIENFWYYAKVELAPPKPSEIRQIATGLAKLIGGIKSGAWKNVTVKQALLNTLVTTEVICWFFVGECIGKRHLVGYDLSKAHTQGVKHH